MTNHLTTTRLALSFCLMTAALAGCASSGTGPIANGNYLDQNESRQLADATQQAAEQSKAGERVEWENKDDKTGLVTTVGWVGPKSESYVASNGDVCRDLDQVVVKGGERHIQSVKACRRTVYTNQPTNDAWVFQQS